MHSVGLAWYTERRNAAAMALRANAHDDFVTAKHWSNTEALLRAGVESNLTMRLDGQTIYAMYRDHTADAALTNDLSWVNLSPVAVAMASAQLNRTRMALTVDAMRRHASFEWGLPKDAGQDNNSSLSLPIAVTLSAVSSSHTGSDFAVIGKGLGWELGWAAHRADWQRVVALLRWLGAVAGQMPVHCKAKPCTPSSGGMLGESYFYARYLAGEWYFADIGNAEQASWFLWGMHHVHAALATVSLSTEDGNTTRAVANATGNAVAVVAQDGLKSDDSEARVSGVPRVDDLAETPAMGINAQSFGAQGDAKTDNSHALQAGIDEAQQLGVPGQRGVPSSEVQPQGRQLLLPAGTYRIKEGLHVRCFNHLTQIAQPGWCAPAAANPLRLTGEGEELTAIEAAPGFSTQSVIELWAGRPTDLPSLAQNAPTNGTTFHRFEHLAIRAGLRPGLQYGAPYGIMGPAVERSSFHSLRIESAASAGIMLVCKFSPLRIIRACKHGHCSCFLPHAKRGPADGFDNRITACYFSANKVGLMLARAANGVHVSQHDWLTVRVVMLHSSC